MRRSKRDLDDPSLSLDEKKALQALYQPSLLADELLKSQRYFQMNNATMPTMNQAQQAAGKKEIGTPLGTLSGSAGLNEVSRRKDSKDPQYFLGHPNPVNATRTDSFIDLEYESTASSEPLFTEPQNDADAFIQGLEDRSKKFNHTMDLDILDMDFNDSSKTTEAILHHTVTHQKQDPSPCNGIDCLKRVE